MPLGFQARRDCQDCRGPLALQGLRGHQAPQVLLDLQVKRGKWAQVFKDRKVKRVTKVSVGLLGCQDRHKLKKKGSLPRRERRVKKVNLDFRGCQGLARKANPESQGLGENLEKMVKKEKKGVRAFLATQDTRDSQAGRALRETKVKPVLRALLELL